MAKFHEQIIIFDEVRGHLGGSPRGKRDGVIRHILGHENGNWMWKIALFRDWSIWHPAWLGKLGVNMNFRQFLGVICAKNLRESGILSSPWGAPFSSFTILKGSDQRFKESSLKKSYRIWSRGGRHIEFSQKISNMMKLKVKKFFFHWNLSRGV